MNKLSKQIVALNRYAGRLSQVLDAALYAFSAYAIPVLILGLSLLAFALWRAQHQSIDPQKISFKVAAGEIGSGEPADGLVRLRGGVSVEHIDTGLSEAPFWILFTVLPEPDSKPVAIEFPSRHTGRLGCWDGASLKSLGGGGAAGVSGSIQSVKAGYALDLGVVAATTRVLCSVESNGPARLSVARWLSTDLQASTYEFHRKSGLLDGGILILAVFVLIAALINRNGLYMIFAVWLVLNLRMGALSAGWDTQWLGTLVPYPWLFRMREITMALYYTVSLTLFATLFRDEMQRLGSQWLLRGAQWLGVPLLLLAVVLPYQSFLPFLWAATGLSIVIMVAELVMILIKTQSPVAMWYAASVAITIAAQLFEVLAAALGLKSLSGAFNSVTAALSSSLLAALAIAAQMRQEHQDRLRAQAELRHTYDAMPIGLFSLDLRGRFLSANPALRRMLGSRLLDSGGQSWQRYFSGGAWAQLHAMVHSQNDGEIELRGRARSFDKADVSRYLVKATLARGRIEGSLQNITEKAKATEELLFLVNNDPLTKVLNRRGIEKALEGALAELAMGKPLSLAYLDLDRFRLINDLYGHSAGDDVLQQVCQRVTNMISGAIHFGRVGSDEFVLVMNDTKIPVATLICRGIIENLGNAPYRVGERAFNVRGSIGLIEVGPQMQVKDAISTADRACHDAKQGGGGLVVYNHDANAFDQYDAELKLVEHLSAAAVTDSLFLMMQPIMSLTSPHGSLNFEVLLRMLDANGDLVQADRVIKAAESSGRLSVIDRWVLSTTLAWLAENQPMLRHTRFVCLNLSGASLNDEKFLCDVYSMLEQNAHVARHLCLEITESVALHDLNNTRRFVDRVRSFGAKVALDDFGAGYTSFSYLKELTADLLKIDGSFIVNMNRHPANVAIVEAIVSLARNLGMKTIAEWAEDAATVQTLMDIGVDYVQGFVVARPQHPQVILQAHSSASFIVDEELMAMVSFLDHPHDLTAQVDLFEQTSLSSLH